MTLKQWIREQGGLCQDADEEAAKILGLKVRTVRAIRHGTMNPSPKTAYHISETVPEVSFRDCFEF